jgi:hypothetical protein
MNPNSKDDPVVERVRQARRALAKECDYDIDKMFELFKSMQAQHPERVRDPRKKRSPPRIRAQG